MPRDGSITRDAIIQAAQSLIYRHGFAGMTLDRLLTETQISKGSFFYHFKSREDLGDVVIARYAEEDAKTLGAYMADAEERGADALEQIVTFVSLLIEAMEASPEASLGCIYGSYAGELDQLSPKARAAVAQGFLLWRQALARKFRAVLQSRVPLEPAKADDLADLFMTIYEGAILTGRALEDAGHLPRQLGHYRSYIRLLFGQRL